MAATIPRVAVDFLTEEINGISADAQARVLEVLRGIKWTPENVAECRELVLQALAAVMPTYTDMAAQASADFYDAARELCVGEALGAKAISGYDQGKTDGAVRALVQSIVDGGPVERFNGQVLQRVDYEMKRAAGTSMLENGRADPAGPRFARVPTGSETCEFCLMLASRGFVYRSERSAGALDHWHANCDCRIVASWDADSVEGYDPDDLYLRWKDPEAWEEKHRNGPDVQRSAGTGDIDRGAAMYMGISSDYVTRIDRVATGASGDAKDIYVAAQGEMRRTRRPRKGKGSYFSPKDETVYFDERTEAARTDVEDCDTWFHEFAHDIDHYSRYGDHSYSSEWRGGAFAQTITEEVRSYIRGRMDEGVPYVEQLLRSGDERSVRRLWKEFGAIDGNTLDAFLSGKISADDVMATVSDRSAFQYTCRKVADEIAALPSEERASVSDLFGGATNNQAVDGYGHDDHYWDYEGRALAQEAFAEMFAGHISSPRSWAAMQRYLPRSCNLFDEMLSELADDWRG